MKRPPRPPQHPIPVPTVKVLESVLRDNAVVLNCGVPITIQVRMEGVCGMTAVIE